MKRTLYMLKFYCTCPRKRKKKKVPWTRSSTKRTEILLQWKLRCWINLPQMQRGWYNTIFGNRTKRIEDNITFPVTTVLWPNHPCNCRCSYHLHYHLAFELSILSKKKKIHTSMTGAKSIFFFFFFKEKDISIKKFMFYEK